MSNCMEGAMITRKDTSLCVDSEAAASLRTYKATVANRAVSSVDIQVWTVWTVN